MATPEDMNFGKSAVALGFVDSKILSSCLQVQQQWSSIGRHVPLEEVMLQRKHLNPSQLDTIKKRRFGRYHIQAEIGAGGMGKVYRAYDPQLERMLALKVMIAGELAKEEDIERFLREAKATAKLRHPNIVAVYDIGNESGRYFFTMDFVKGLSLRDLLCEANLTTRNIVEILIKVGDAVHSAHRSGIIHRDLKPANIMMDEGKEPRVMDFGLAKVMDDKKLSRSGVMLGTLQYMPPEQAEGRHREVDARSDVYALGAILYEMLTGRLPFVGTSIPEVLMQIVSKEPIPPSEIKKKTPKDLENICLKALEKKPGKRYQSAATFIDDLTRFLQGVAVEAPAVRWHRRLWQKMTRHKVLAGSLAAVILVVTALIFGISLNAYFERQGRLSQQAKKTKVRQGRIAKAVSATYKLIKQFSNEKLLRKKYGRKYIHEEISFAEQLERKATLKKLRKQLITLEHTLELSPNNTLVKKCLYDLEKQMGLIALEGKYYLLSELSFERCRNLFKEEEMDILLKQVQEYQKKIAQAQLKQVEKILQELGNKPPPAGMWEEYQADILRMRGSHIIEKMVSRLSSKSPWQRYLAIEILGKLKDRNTKVNGKDSVEWLIDRLTSLNAKGNQVEAEKVVWALGRLRDKRANDLVNKVRWDVGQNTNFWKRTELPYSWLPVDKSKLPKTSKGWDKHGVMLNTKGLIKESIAAYNKALELDSRNAEAYAHRGLAYAMGGDLKRALKDLSTALNIDPTYGKGYNNRGGFYMKLKRLDDALRDFDQAIKLDPKDASAYGNRALAHLQKGHNKKALEDANYSLKLDNTDSMVFSNRAMIYLQMGEIEKALKDCDKAILLNSHELNAIMNRAVIYEKQGKIEASIADLTLALDVQPRYPPIYLRRGELLILKKDFRAALDDFNQAVQLAPRNPWGYYNRGLTYNLMGNVEKALEQFTHAIRRDSYFSRAYYQRAKIYDNENRPEKAVPEFVRYLQLRPNAKEAPSIKRYLRALGVLRK